MHITTSIIAMEVYLVHCDYTDVGNGALRTSSMADTLTGSCLFVPISSPVQQFLA